MAMMLVKLVDPLATDTLHSTLSVVGEVTLTTACIDPGTAASAGSVFIATWSTVVGPDFSMHSTVSPAPVCDISVLARTTQLPAVTGRVMIVVGKVEVG